MEWGDNWQLVFLPVASVLAFASTLFIAFLFHLVVEQRVWWPALVAVVTGIVTIIVMTCVGFGLPGRVRFISVPLFVASVSGAICLRRRHLQALGPSSESGPFANRLRDFAVILCGTLGAYLFARTELGERLLLSLGYDVIGNTRAEIWEGRIAGGVVGFFAGAAVGLIAWGIFARRRSAQ